MIKLDLSYEELKNKTKIWETDKSINPFTKRKIKPFGPTYMKIDTIFNNFKDNKTYKTKTYKTHGYSEIDIEIQNIFINKHFNISYDIELKKYLFILVYLEFRSRELYLQYLKIYHINYTKTKAESKEIRGQPFKNARLLFYILVKNGKIPFYTKNIISDEFLKEQTENDQLDVLKTLYKGYYELLSEHYFEDKYVASKKDIDFEKLYILEEINDTKEYFFKIDVLFKNNPKYNNIKLINNNLNIKELVCDTCGKRNPRLLCHCGVNIYCTEKCKIKDMKDHYVCCNLYYSFKNKNNKYL